jgi:hypothetical protein
MLRIVWRLQLPRELEEIDWDDVNDLANLNSKTLAYNLFPSSCEQSYPSVHRLDSSLVHYNSLLYNLLPEHLVSFTGTILFPVLPLHLSF